jgi:hypothetical protein
MCTGGPTSYNINGQSETLGTQSPEDAAWIRANRTASYSSSSSPFPGSNDLSNAVLGWQSIAGPQQPDLADTTLQATKQAQLFGMLGSTGYQATFMGKG